MARATRYHESKLQVLEHIAANATAPTVRSLAERFNVGVATMHSYLTKLAEEGLVEWRPRSHRSLHCTDSGVALIAAQSTAGREAS